MDLRWTACLLAPKWHPTEPPAAAAYSCMLRCVILCVQSLSSFLFFFFVGLEVRESHVEFLLGLLSGGSGFLPESSV